jgi:hypothetical protein
MKTRIILFMIIAMTSYSGLSQNLFNKLPKNPTHDDLRAYNKLNLASIELGMSKQEVIKFMRSSCKIQTYYVTEGESKSQERNIVSNPCRRDLYKNLIGNKVEILWYYTTKKNNNNYVEANEMTPIVLEKNKVIGFGWIFFNDYGTRNSLNI